MLLNFLIVITAVFGLWQLILAFYTYVCGNHFDVNRLAPLRIILVKVGKK